jgi:hypothetical protein
VISEPDGYFSYIGLSPGKYTASVDPAQLGKLKMVGKPPELPFEIKENPDGDVVEGLEFQIEKASDATTK